MLFVPGASKLGARRGFSLPEVQAAFLILGFSVAALFPFAVAQLRLVAALEERVPANTTFVLISRDNHVLKLLYGGTNTPTTSEPQITPLIVSPASQGPATEGFGPGSRPVAIDSVTSGNAYTNEWTAVVTVKPSSSGGGQ